MRWLTSLLAVSVLFVICAAVAAPAVAQPRLDVFVTPIPNAPFSGTINVERSSPQPDGSVISLRTARDIGRDSRGRIFTESRMLLPAASSETPMLVGVLLYDPQTRLSTRLNTRNHTFTQGTDNRPPATVPPAFLDASQSNRHPQNQFTKEEDLGIHEIDGVPAHGVRETQSIPSDTGDPAKATVITDEYWYSEDLRINLVIRHSDPRTGSVTMRLTQIRRAEPDPARFEIPEGYVRAGMRQEAKE
ncbi:MAG TPA: hypothetical protein VFT65_11100 [Candidatus Angelobacter sp.]|nr:hypothetical protein [Candidatus Angelobacter sp.]